MALDPTDRRPKYIQIADAWREEIRSGRLKAGDRLPSAVEMHARYGVSAETALKAIRILVAAGLVETMPSRGAVVIDQPRLIQRSAAYVTEEDGRPLDTWRSALARDGLEGTQDLLGVARVVAPDEVAVRLQLPEDDLVVVRRRIMFVSRTPYQLADSYYPASIAGGTVLERPAKIAGGSIAALKALGHEPTRHLEELTFHPALVDEQRVMRLSAGVWIVRILRTTFAEGDVPVEVTDMALAADRHELLYEVPARRA